MFCDVKSQLLLLYAILTIGVVLFNDLRYIIMLASGSIIGAVILVWNECIILRFVRPNADGVVQFSHSFVIRPSKVITGALSARLDSTRQINIEHCTCKLVEELMIMFRQEKGRFALDHVALNVSALDLETCISVINYMKEHADVKVFHIQNLVINEGDPEGHLTTINNLLQLVPHDRKASIGYATKSEYMTCTNFE